MPLVSGSEFKPSLLYRGSHLGTLIPHYFGNKKVSSFKRARITTPDNDFLDIDAIKNGNDKLVILFHGLEGSSSSNYIQNMTNLLLDHEFDIVAMNYRGCSGEINRQIRMYHSGATDDIQLVLDKYIKNYKSISLIGYSLGANMVIKYLGEHRTGISPKIVAAIGISAPCDLKACSEVISKRSNYIYEKRFLVSLTKKIKLKAKLHPEAIDITLLRRIITLRDFDELYTGPIHGFKDADEYYQLNSSNRFLDGVSIPLLIINSENDPFLDHKVFPVDFASSSEYVHLMITSYGGHVGFMSRDLKNSWADNQALKFLLARI